MFFVENVQWPVLLILYSAWPSLFILSKHVSHKTICFLKKLALFIELNVLESTKAVCTIYSTGGNKVQEDSVNLKKGMQVIQLPVAGIKAGMYYLKIAGTESQPVQFSFIKTDWSL